MAHGLETLKYTGTDECVDHGVTAAYSRLARLTPSTDRHLKQASNQMNTALYVGQTVKTHTVG